MQMQYQMQMQCHKRRRQQIEWLSHLVIKFALQEDQQNNFEGPAAADS